MAELLVEELRLAMQLVGCSGFAQARQDAAHILRQT
jgi:hypothetical protein